MKSKIVRQGILFLSVSLYCLLPTISFAQENTCFVISSPNNCAQIIFNKNEDELVHTATRLFSDDVYNVSGQRPELTAVGDTKYQIKIGTVGLDKDFDKECKKAGIDVDELKTEWETYNIKVVAQAKRNTLLVVGSNPRGTAYGLMELSRMIGVSPWYWWADVEPEKQEMISLPNDMFLEDAPQVKFRGIFLNDEDWGLQPWAAKTFEPETGDIGSKTYEKVFELLLRLKANAIWPAMHNCTRAFFTYPGNIKMADKYGIWVGSSHCEPMLRNNVDEWHRWSPSNNKRGDWNFDENPEQLKEYWRERIDTTAQYDGIYTIGMRGIHDGGMPGGKTLQDKVQILNRVFQAQREILGEVTGKDATSIPQIFCPYKEVLDIYRAGANVPDDVTIMWADDNNGYIRQLSNNKERKRSGGAGVYYHISYWGRPHDYLWLESTPVSLIWEEMNKAYQTNAKNVWIVNVGDIKSNEIGMDFFLDMAWNPEKYLPGNLDSYYSKFAKNQFGEQYALQIGEILKKYFQLGFSRKPEHLGWNGVYPNTPVQDPELSLFNYGDEVQKRIEAYDSLEQQAGKLYSNMPDRLKDAFFELVLYPVTGASNMNKKMLYAYKSRVYAQQKRNSANGYAEKAQKAFGIIKQETEKYNHEIANGKWKNMMSYHPRNLPVFDMPKVGLYKPEEGQRGGIVPEGYVEAVSPIPASSSLPEFNSLTQKEHFIDIFNSGTKPLKWKAQVDHPWVKLSQTSGLLDTEIRITVSIDWDVIPVENSIQSAINIQISDHKYLIGLHIVNPDWVVPDEKSFVEDNGVIAVEAENFSRIKRTGQANWQKINGLGRTGDAMGTYPISLHSFLDNEEKKAPVLEYDFYSTSTGNATVLFYCLPSQPVNSEYQLRFAVQVDNNQPIIVNSMLTEKMDEHNSEWQNNVLNASSIKTCQIHLNKAGKHVLKVRMIDPGVVLDKIEIDLKGKKASYFGAIETIVVK